MEIKCTWSGRVTHTHTPGDVVRARWSTAAALNMVCALVRRGAGLDAWSITPGADELWEVQALLKV